MTLDEAMCGEQVSYKEARHEVIKHNASWLEFIQENGSREFYTSNDVLSWLGY